MIQLINNIVNTSYETLVHKRADEILKVFQGKLEISKASSFFSPELLEYKHVAVSDNTIEILRYPSIISPFRSYGKIKFYLEPTNKVSWTKIRCEILPGNNSMGYLVIYQLVTTLALAIGFWFQGNDMSTKIGGALVVFVGPVIISYFIYSSARRELMDYSRSVIKTIRY